MSTCVSPSNDRIAGFRRVSAEKPAVEAFKREGAGWGVIAKNLGIKPGSAAFHELKDTSKVKKHHAQQQKNKHKNKNKGKKN